MPPNERSPLELEVSPRGSCTTADDSNARSVKRRPFKGSPWMACCATTSESPLLWVSMATGVAVTVTTCTGTAGANRNCTTETPPTNNSTPRLVRVAMPGADALTS